MTITGFFAPLQPRLTSLEQRLDDLESQRLYALARQLEFLRLQLKYSTPTKRK